MPDKEITKAMGNETMLQVLDLHKSFPAALTAAPAKAPENKDSASRFSLFARQKKAPAVNEILHGISFEVNKGDVLAVLGPSGSGKTTMLRCLNFLERAEKGSVTLRGQELSLKRASKAQIAEYRMHTGFVFQNYNLFSNKTALQNVTEGLIIARKIPKEEAERKGLEVLQKVGLSDKRDFYPSQLSGGQQQRVAIARAIASDPDIIFFDEPTSALDPELIGEVLSVIRQLAKEGMTMIIVTHEIHFAREVASHVLFMEDGQALYNGPAADFFETSDNARVQSFLRILSAES